MCPFGIPFLGDDCPKSNQIQSFLILYFLGSSLNDRIDSLVLICISRALSPQGSGFAGEFPFSCVAAFGLPLSLEFEGFVMFAVVKTGGKQYRVKAGDLLVCEKLAGEPGAVIKFDQVLMVSDDKGAVVGAPVVDGASVEGTLIETRKGDKVRIFKKIRRQGYRRTRGHRQTESVVRITALSGGGKKAAWDGTVSLMTKAEMDARARGLSPRIEAAPVEAEAKPAAKKTPAKKAAAQSEE